MSIVTYEGKIESPVPPATLFKMIFAENEIYLPKVFPNADDIKVEIVEGDGGAGTIRHVSFGKGSPVSHLRELTDFIDVKNCICHYSVIGGDPALIDTSKVEKYSFELKMEATPNGGTIAKRSSKGHIINGVEVDEEEVRASLVKTMEVFVGVFKTFEVYALANPDA